MCVVCFDRGLNSIFQQNITELLCKWFEFVLLDRRVRQLSPTHGEKRRRIHTHKHTSKLNSRKFVVWHNQNKTVYLAFLWWIRNGNFNCSTKYYDDKTVWNFKLKHVQCASKHKQRFSESFGLLIVTKASNPNFSLAKTGYKNWLLLSHICYVQRKIQFRVSEFNLVCRFFFCSKINFKMVYFHSKNYTWNPFEWMECLASD